jgi:hypothetical protein
VLGNLTVFVVAAIVLVGLESWRRALRDRAPRWVHVVAILLMLEIILGVAVAEYRLYQAFRHLESEAASDKANALARDISSAMNSNAIAVAGVLLSVIVLGVGTVLARRRLDNAPPSATLRS